MTNPSSLLGFDFADSINFLKEEEEGEEFGNKFPPA